MYNISLYSQLKWNYVSVVYSRSVYGIEGYNSLIKAKANYPNICFGPSHMIPNNFKSDDYVNLVDKLYNKDRPSGEVTLMDIFKA